MPLWQWTIRYRDRQRISEGAFWDTLDMKKRTLSQAVVITVLMNARLASFDYDDAVVYTDHQSEREKTKLAEGKTSQRRELCAAEAGF